MGSLQKRSLMVTPSKGSSFIIQFLSIVVLVIASSSPSSSSPSSSAAAAAAGDESSSFSSSANASLFWGSYRPNLYFGTKTRSEGGNGILTGLMWHGLSEFGAYQRPFNNVVLRTEMLKVPGGKHGGDVVVRIIGESLNGEEADVMLYYYVGLDGIGTMDLKSNAEEKGYDGPVVAGGSTPDLGDFQVTFMDSFEDQLNPAPSSGPHLSNLPFVGKTQLAGLRLPPGELWKVKNYLSQVLVKAAQANVDIMQKASIQPNPPQVFSFRSTIQDDPNVFIFQKAVTTPFSIDIIYNSKSAGRFDSVKDYSGHALTSKFQEASFAYENRFETSFQLRKKGYNADQIRFAQSVLSNLIGGIGQFHGHNLIDRALEERAREEIVDTIQNIFDDDDEDDYFGGDGDELGGGPWTLFSAVPSRSFFPRGFMWDEGFHQLLIGKWDNDLSLDIVSHWAHLIDERGWVAREQILGDEAHSKVPKEFQVQYSHFGNPPTLVLALTSFIDRLQNSAQIEAEDTIESQYNFGSDPINPTRLANGHLKDRTKAKAYLTDMYERFKRQRSWFRQTQWGDTVEWHPDAPAKDEAYRWRGRTDRHTLTSGLDDYPRSFPPHVGELHVDLISWMGFMSKSLKRIAEEVGEKEDVEKYDNELKGIIANLDALHWDSDAELFCDVTIENGARTHVIHPGYLSLFPYVLGLVSPADTPKLLAFLRLIRDPNHLWTPHGLRSLSKSDAFFATDENYWRGPIWINLNYLVLGALKGYAEHEGVDGKVRNEAGEVYKELRQNIVGNVYKVYQRTGFVWEQYSPEDGDGKRSHPFTGWTSLIVLIMAENYPSLL
ncbi:glycoside hydrolase [Chytridium lagenaria]|nr:glycoside hydrolase [Chytridium lagenaria]